MEFLWDAWNALYQFVQPADPPYPYSWAWDAGKILAVLFPALIFLYIALECFKYTYIGKWLHKKYSKLLQKILPFQTIYLNIAKPLHFVFYYSIGYICASLFFFEWGADEIDANSIRGIALFIFIAVCLSYIKFLGEAVILESRINELETDMKIRKAKEALVKDYNNSLLNSIARLNTLTILERIAHDSASHRWEITTTLQDYISTNSPLKHEENETKSEDDVIIRANEIIKWCYDNEPR